MRRPISALARKSATGPMGGAPSGRRRRCRARVSTGGSLERGTRPCTRGEGRLVDTRHTSLTKRGPREHRRQTSRH
eukprot:3734103-Pyramimonas_sp.AAC.1